VTRADTFAFTRTQRGLVLPDGVVVSGQIASVWIVGNSEVDATAGAPIGTPIGPRMRAANKNEKGLYDWSTFCVR